MPNRPVFQGVTDAQMSIVEYWKNHRDSDGRMRRADVDPGGLRAELACISIVEIDSHGDCVVRLAGSELRDWLGVDARGRRLDDVLDHFCDVFTLSIAAALEAGHPVGGVVDDGGALRSWLRIPLVGADGQLSQVLCHDAVVPHPRYIRGDNVHAHNVQAYQRLAVA